MPTTITERPFTNLSLFAPSLSFIIPLPLRNNRDLWYFNISLKQRFYFEKICPLFAAIASGCFGLTFYQTSATRRAANSKSDSQSISHRWRQRATTGHVPPRHNSRDMTETKSETNFLYGATRVKSLPPRKSSSNGYFNWNSLGICM